MNVQDGLLDLQGATIARMPSEKLLDFGRRYAAAWCSRDPVQVASFFSPDGSLTINDGEPAVGRAAIAEAARSFMTAFPDLRVVMDDLRERAARVEFYWTLTGTNSGPGGTGREVCITGFEEWLIGDDGLVSASLGHFDAADYARQVGNSNQ